MAIMAMPCLQTPLVLVGTESMGKKMLGVLLPIVAGVKQIEGFLLLLMETNTFRINGGFSFIGNGELSNNFLKPRKNMAITFSCHLIPHPFWNFRIEDRQLPGLLIDMGMDQYLLIPFFMG